ncbi:3D-(3,5/4)-trihydroxycyclohexane-1,2-dione acylhydrolase (decyclizing) [Antrihabitans stalactiti]|uniref:acetolactate synthase n=1 Tax=Antrihabitans stalactiti TaxID=2584121 RepID=A0A848K7Z8_9NOCA|nr:3D-(3,5/4)-trihydroxycyclohexane-1,2-dione acylhydrolase (decyclizing) [Antrihabitans stalactiti]NMN94479.1 3D-(3,5/4)-trihydroxycyclohexane-1,2-dione acylhydrolase (decyclizing) [Antrihabitans stalactiti]
MGENVIRLTVGQAVVRFLSNQYTERDGQSQRLFAGCLGIFGHGNVAGLGEALLAAELEDPKILPYIVGRNEQAMVHTAVAYARAKNRLQTWAVTTSVGPGATNMVTGAALATINRLPVLLLPADTFATRVATPVLQELELPGSGDVTVNDAFRPVSRYFDRVWRPEQLPAALIGAMRVLTDPVDTGAATIAIPEDVQTQAFDWPESLFAHRVWHVRRPPPERSAISDAAALIRTARSPLIVAGGGVTFSGAAESLARFAALTGIPVAQTQAGKNSMLWDHPQCVGAVGATGTTAANALAADADLVIGIGTRYSDFTTASRTAFANPDVRFVNINIGPADAVKHGGCSVVADAREALDALALELPGHSVSDEYRTRTQQLVSQWNAVVDRATTPEPGSPTQAQVIGLVNVLSDDRDVVVCAAGSMPGDLHRLWRTRDLGSYHVEYGYSCMGYEVAGGLGVGLAHRDRDVFVLVGDGSYLMMASELATAVQERIKLIVVLVDNRGFGSIGALSDSVGSQRFGTVYRFRGPDGRLSGEHLPIDLAANAASLGADVIRCSTASEFADAMKVAKANDAVTVLYVQTDPMAAAPSSESWWDVPVAEVSTLPETREARAAYDTRKRSQSAYLRPTVEGSSS